ncbi:DUF1616 domain-containing protein [Halorubrum ejinorense]|uniref:DUF1616 domain-containing protein n=1 Tax=Halorubrum ejinorense TaxID=425309 RepID=A0AAV3SVI7_9EURY
MGEPDAADEHSLDPIADLLAIAALLVIVAVFVFVAPLRDTPLRPAVSLVFALFAPGYVYLSALFPKRFRPGETSDNASAAAYSEGGLGLLERLVFSFGVSAAITILLGLALGYWLPGISRINLYTGLAVLIAVGLPVAAKRRSGLPSDVRMRSPHRAVTTRIRSRLANQGATANAATVLLAVALVAAAASVGVGGGSSQGSEVTELYLLSENESGEYVPRQYPETVTRGENESFALGITNQEGGRTTYTVEVLLQEFDGGNGTGPLIAETRVRTFSADLDDGERERIPHTIEPTVGAGSYRLTYLLYVGEPPADPSIDSAYREVHLWIRVT